MWTRLNIWVMAPANACHIDDRDGWIVHTVDAHLQPFTWKGYDYSKGTPVSANGFLDYELPPGTFVVWAERKDKRTTVKTHRAVVAIHDEPHVVVRLLPDLTPKAPPEDREPPRQHECELAIQEVHGYMRGHDLPVRLEVSGTAYGCDEVHVEVRRPEGGAQVQGDVTVDASGRWTFRWDNEVQMRCGETVLVEVRCARDRKCRERAERTITCREDD